MEKQIYWKEDCVFPLFVLNYPCLKSYFPGAAPVSPPSTKGYAVLHIEALATCDSQKYIYFFFNVMSIAFKILMDIEVNSCSPIMLFGSVLMIKL